MNNQEYFSAMEKSVSDFEAGKAIFSAAIRFVHTADKNAVEAVLEELKAVKKNDTALYLAVALTIEHCNTRLEKLARKSD
jgi:hypothetical protein